jgi:RNA polymerase sigma factor (sigma-70 family)
MEGTVSSVEESRRRAQSPSLVPIKTSRGEIPSRTIARVRGPKADGAPSGSREGRRTSGVWKGVGPRLTDLFLRSQSDERLVTLAQAGHERAFAVIVERYRRELQAFARGRNSDGRAEDIVQQAFLGAFAALQSGADVGHLRGWLYRIVRNEAIKAQASTIHVPLDDVAACGEPLEDVVQRRAIALSALSELNGLPSRQREALVETALRGSSRADVARTMGLSEGAVRQLVHRARNAVRTAVTGLTPYPLAQLFAGSGSGAASDASVAAGAASAGGVAVKLGAVLASGVVATGIATVQISHSSHPAPPRASAAQLATKHRNGPALIASATTDPVAADGLRRGSDVGSGGPGGRGDDRSNRSGEANSGDGSSRGPGRRGPSGLSQNGSGSAGRGGSGGGSSARDGGAGPDRGSAGTGGGGDGHGSASGATEQGGDGDRTRSGGSSGGPGPGGPSQSHDGGAGSSGRGGGSGETSGGSGGSSGGSGKGSGGSGDGSGGSGDGSSGSSGGDRGPDGATISTDGANNGGDASTDVADTGGSGGALSGSDGVSISSEGGSTGSGDSTGGETGSTGSRGGSTSSRGGSTGSQGGSTGAGSATR